MQTRGWPEVGFSFSAVNKNADENECLTDFKMSVFLAKKL